ncbi:hypothetical protein ASF00_09405 [Sphingomonas sp. Leaf34]|nr:hypothetical protein ASF00_09405 [Sphingomonas sp. Leaf34]
MSLPPIVSRAGRQQTPTVLFGCPIGRDKIGFQQGNLCCGVITRDTPYEISAMFVRRVFDKRIQGACDDCALHVI